MSYSPETVHQIYGSISQNNLCFAVEVNSKIIGECWLQKMNLLNEKAMYDENLDVRRIDMAMGEKDYWGKNGFELILTEELPQPQKGKLQYHWRLTKEKYNQVSAGG